MYPHLRFLSVFCIHKHYKKKRPGCHHWLASDHASYIYCFSSADLFLSTTAGFPMAAYNFEDQSFKHKSPLILFNKVHWGAQ